jgi:hypothetical protein
MALPGIAWNQIGSRQILPREPVELDPWLREWLRQPRIPVLESAEPVVVGMIDAALRGEEVEFTYFGGSEPGRPRRISPGMVFHLEGSDVLYVSGFCHCRKQERVFRVDRIGPDIQVGI